jgi:hypothetical protein
VVLGVVNFLLLAKARPAPGSRNPQPNSQKGDGPFGEGAACAHARNLGIALVQKFLGKNDDGGYI